MLLISLVTIRLAGCKHFVNEADAVIIHRHWWIITERKRKNLFKLIMLITMNGELLKKRSICVLSCCHFVI
jgi:hypothetical protein